MPYVSAFAFAECSKLSQATEEFSELTRSDRLWSQLIFSDTWHWDPLTSTQHIQQTAMGGEHRAQALSKEAHSASMIRPRLDIWEPDYSGNELGNVANDFINKRLFRCPFSLWSLLWVHFSFQAHSGCLKARKMNQWHFQHGCWFNDKHTKRPFHLSHQREKKRYKHIVVKVTATYKHR